MLTRPFVLTLVVLLILAYFRALAVSTAHLSQLYALFNTGLPYSVSIGLAVALEAVAFLFSIISTSLGRRAGPWAAWASTSALLLVWAGNGYAMLLAAPTQPLYVTVIASCFVPVCTLMVGKVLGGLFGLLADLSEGGGRVAVSAVSTHLIAPATSGHGGSGGPLKDDQSDDPASVVGLERTVGSEQALVPKASLNTARVPGAPDLPVRSPTVLGGHRLPVTPSPRSPRGLPDTRGGRGASRNAEGQDTPGEVTGLRACTDEALVRVDLSRAELERLAATLKVHATAKVSARQRVLALTYSQAGVALTHLAADLRCDESTLRAALRQTKATMTTADQGEQG